MTAHQVLALLYRVITVAWLVWAMLSPSERMTALGWAIVVALWELIEHVRNLTGEDQK